MIIGVIIQQPVDNIDYLIDATSIVGIEDELISIEAKTVPDGLNVVALVTDTFKGTLWVSGGVANTEYKIDMDLTTAKGRIRQDELIVKIEEF
jgi:hypothetical protein